MKKKKRDDLINIILGICYILHIIGGIICINFSISFIFIFKSNTIHGIIVGILGLIGISVGLIGISFYKKDSNNSEYIKVLEDSILYNDIPEKYENQILELKTEIKRLSKWKNADAKRIDTIKAEIRRIEKEKENELDKIKNDPDNKVLILMINNMSAVKEYFDITKRQMNSSFRLSVASAIIGFIIIGLAIVLIFLGIEVQPIFITSIAGAFIEIFAATTFMIHKKSAEQFNYYYNSLHEDQTLLSLLHIVTLMDDDKKDETYTEIIKSQLQKLNNTKTE